MRVQERFATSSRIPVRELQRQPGRLRAIVADAIASTCSRARRFRRSGPDLHVAPGGLHVGDAERAGRFQLLQHEGQRHPAAAISE